MRALFWYYRALGFMEFLFTLFPLFISFFFRFPIGRTVSESPIPFEYPSPPIVSFHFLSSSRRCFRVFFLPRFSSGISFCYRCCQAGASFPRAPKFILLRSFLKINTEKKRREREEKMNSENRLNTNSAMRKEKTESQTPLPSSILVRAIRAFVRMCAWVIANNGFVFATFLGSVCG